MAESSVRRRLLQGAGANAYGTVVVAIVQLAGVPILLHAWGTQRYGAWLVLFAIPAYLSLTNLGYSLSIANDMTMRTARGDRTGALTAFHSLIALVTATGVVGAVVTLALVFGLPLVHWLHLVDLAPWQVRDVLLLLAAGVLVQLTGGIAAAGYRANGDYGLGLALNNSIMFVQYLALWAAALAGLGLVGAAAAFLLVRVIGNIAMLLHLVRRHRWLNFGVRHANLHYLRRLISPSFANFLLPLANALKNQGLLLVVNALLGPLAVVVFSVLRTLTRLSLRLVSIVSQAIEPEVATAEGGEDRVLQRRLYLAGLQASFWLSIVAGAVLYFAGNEILHLWTHGRVAMDRPLFVWLLAGALVAALWHVSLSMLQALNRHRSAALAYVLSAAGMVGLAWLLIDFTGQVRQAGLSMLIGDAVFTLYVFWVTNRAIGSSLGGVLAQTLNPLTLIYSARPSRILSTRSAVRSHRHP
ncbi:MAG: lipopolysaccharide biosynthesis protein [Gammaproteobacteria bacterium]